MRRRHLPLTALRSFEAAGRNQSFTRAAADLCVSQAAISRQVRDLEVLLGQKLFDRYPQRVELTARGTALLATLSTAFDAIADRLDSLGSGAVRSAVYLSVEPSFAATLLVARLKGFSDDHPDIEIAIETGMRLIEFRAHEPRLAIRYGQSPEGWTNTQSRHLFDSDLIAVISAGLLREGPPLRTPGDFLSYRLLHEQGEACWPDWFRAAGVRVAGADRGQTFDHMGLVLQAALNGQGVAVLDRTFAAPYLESGALVQPFATRCTTGAYWIVARDFARLTAPEMQLVDWVCREFGAR